ncbi:MAG: TlpA disulfide reductase family protein [Pseudomonadota bacterium]
MGLADARRRSAFAAALGLLLYASTLLTMAVPARADDDAPEPPLFRSHSSQFTLLSPIAPAPATPVRALDGRLLDLGAFRGKVVLLNFWATWCQPCIYEMPTLDRLAAAYPSDKLAIAAVSIDQAGAQAVVPFIERYRLAHLPVYLDPAQNLGTFDAARAADGAFALYGLPISYIIDRDGRVLGYLTGAAEWDSPDARAFLDYFVQRAK